MSLFKKSFVAIAFALSAQAHAIELAPLDLAIQHFNAQHSKPLALWSAEHQFMVQALSAVEKNHPEVMTHPEGGKGIALFNPQERQFKALVAEIYLSKKHPDATQEALQKEVDAEVTKLISTCGWSKETHTSETSNSTSKRIRTTQTYSLNYGPCEKLPSSSEATRLGLVSVTVDKTESPYGDSYVYSVDSQSYQDMVFVRNQLAKSANWQVLANI